MTQKGADVSYYQGDANWNAFADDNGFVYVSIGDGDVVDRLWTPGRVKAIRAAELKHGFGVYYYGRVAALSNNFRHPHEEFEMAIKRAKKAGWGKAGVDLRFMYDIEETNGRSVMETARHVLGFVRAHQESEGYRPGIYGPYYFLKALNAYWTPKEREEVRKCPLWIADLEGAVDVPLPWENDRDFAIHQNTFTAHKAGIRGFVDGDLGGPEFDRLVIPKEKK